VIDTFEVWWEKNCRLDKNSSREIWQASRENQEEYQKHEFCRAVGCSNLYNGKNCVIIGKETGVDGKEYF